MGEAPEYFSLFLSVALFVTQIIFELESHRIGNSWFRLKVNSNH